MGETVYFFAINFMLLIKNKTLKFYKNSLLKGEKKKFGRLVFVNSSELLITPYNNVFPHSF